MAGISKRLSALISSDKCIVTIKHSSIVVAAVFWWKLTCLGVRYRGLDTHHFPLTLPPTTTSRVEISINLTGLCLEHLHILVDDPIQESILQSSLH